MKTQVLILLISISVWGWFNQQWPVSGLISFFVVVSLLTRWRWEITRQQFHRMGDLASVFIILALLYGVFLQSEQKSVFMILKWLPVFFAPVLFAQLFSSQGTVPLGILFYSVRKRSPDQVTQLDFKIPFAALCLLSSGSANDQSVVYFIITAAVLILILWTARSSQGSIIVWVLVILISTVIAFYGQQKLRSLHSIIEEKAIDWLSDWQTDPFKTHTAIGDIGDLKLSNRIEYRVKAAEGLLLQQSSYDRYLGQTWYASKRTFKVKSSSPKKPAKQLNQLQIFQQPKRESILALPAGTVDIKGLEGAILQYSELGVVKLSEAPEFVNYEVFYTGRQSGESSQYDLDVPPQHQNWIALIKQDLKLENQPATVITKSIVEYFRSKYFYTLFLGLNSNADQALQEFVLKRKAGHCEYFAVASVFLLRSYGIPARLANGYAMQEYDATEQMFIVRRRHAHAWAIANVDGEWLPVDATPGQWLTIEDANSDFLQPLFDWFSSIQFSYKQWRYQQAQSNYKEDKLIGIGIVVILIIYLVWRMFTARRQIILNKKLSEATATPNHFLGKDSELYLIEQALKTTANARLMHESCVAWSTRINSQDLIDISKKHYRYRFDPQGISKQQRLQLKRDVEAWFIKSS